MRCCPPRCTQRIKASKRLAAVRGTVQADILKEDQAQNTCIFSTEFSLRLMGDVQQYFIWNRQSAIFIRFPFRATTLPRPGPTPLRNWHLPWPMASPMWSTTSPGAWTSTTLRPISASSFSNGIDPEYAVIGRVARRIWAKALMKNMEPDRTRARCSSTISKPRAVPCMRRKSTSTISAPRLQALYAIYDNCNSLHTNAYDEAITTPTEGSVRRAMAIQLIINKELGLAKNENPLAGFLHYRGTDRLGGRGRVLWSLTRITERGGVLGAMETMYQRGKIQEESPALRNPQAHGRVSHRWASIPF